MPRVTLIVARAINGVIGLNNALPWHLPEDLRHFKATTVGHTVLMGRRTYESIGRPLPGRRNLVLSRQPNWKVEGCERVGSIEEAIASCPTDADLFVAGGDEVYRQALASADRAIITEIDITPAGDAFFEPLDEQRWQRTSSEAFESAGGLRYRINHFQRRAQIAASNAGASA